MTPRHPDPCASRGETTDALRTAQNHLLAARNEAERILAGAHDGCCDIHQALWATDLGRELLAIAGLLGEVEAATAQAMASAAPAAQEAA